MANALRTDKLVIPQGTTWAIRWPLQDAAGFPLVTAGWTLRAQIRYQADAVELLHEFSTELGNATVTDSYAELRVEPAESSAWNWINDCAVFDVELTTEVGNVIRLTQGTVYVSAEVTQ